MPRLIEPWMASQPPSASTPTWPSAGMACSAGCTLPISRTARIRAANSRLLASLEPVELLLLLAEALDHPHAGDRGLDHAGDGTGLLLGVPGRREQPAPGRERHQDSAGPTSSATSGQQRRQNSMMTSETDEQQQVARQHRDQAEQALHHVEVGDGAAHHLAGVQLVLARAVEPGQRAEQLGAQVVLHVEGYPAAHVPPHVDRAEDGQRRDHQRDRQRPDRLRCA